MKSALMFLMVLMASFAVNAAESNVIRVDTRSSYGAKVATGIETFGRSDGSGTTSVDTRKYPDGWRTMTSGADSTSLSILNGSSVEGGIISSSVTWKPTRRYVIRDDVLLSGDALLVIRKGTEIQMTENASIIAPNIGNVECAGAQFISLNGYNPNEIGLYAVSLEDDVGKTYQTNYYSAGVSVKLPVHSFPGMAFAGWSVPGSDDLDVFSYVVAPSNVTFRAHWYENTYTVRFVSKDTWDAIIEPMTCEPNRVYLLPKFACAKDGKRFAGWACSNGRRYDDGMLVFDLAKPGETVTMTAIWE